MECHPLVATLRRVIALHANHSEFFILFQSYLKDFPKPLVENTPRRASERQAAGIPDTRRGLDLCLFSYFCTGFRQLAKFHHFELSLSLYFQLVTVGTMIAVQGCDCLTIQRVMNVQSAFGWDLRTDNCGKWGDDDGSPSDCNRI